MKRIGRRTLAASLAFAFGAALPQPAPAGTALGPPGSLISSAPIAPPNGVAARAWKVRYVSTDVDGKRIEVTGVVVAPAAAAATRPVVAWAHPTSGVMPRCAPSTRGPGYAWIAGLSSLLAAGFVVTATDYQGLGTTGVHHYLVGASEARSVIDSVRAVGHLPDARAGKRYAVWGHSQGGHAALWTAGIARSYAPELSLAGVAAAAPPTDLTANVEQTTDATPSRVVAAYTFEAWSDAYHLPLAAVLKPPALALVRRVAAVCAQTPLDAVQMAALTAPLRSVLLTRALQRDARWGAAFVRNAAPIQRTVPLFIAQGVNDGLVVPAVTARYVEAACAAGDRVEFERLPEVTHAGSGVDAAPAAVRWMQARFAGTPAPSTCAAAR